MQLHFTVTFTLQIAISVSVLEFKSESKLYIKKKKEAYKDARWQHARVVVFFRVFPGSFVSQSMSTMSHRELINIGLQPTMPVTVDFQQTPNIPMDIARPFGSPWVVVGPTKQPRRCREPAYTPG